MEGAYFLSEVKTKKDIRDFHKVAEVINGHDPNWIKPLKQDIETIFNPQTNTLFRNGDAIRWIMTDSRGNLSGRVAAFYSRKIANAREAAPGSMGFFECINDGDAAATLFNACRTWLENNGFTLMEGPVNFGERDRWWGLLVKGFLPPNYCMPYNPPYYRELFESYGFRNYFEQYTYYTPVTGDRMSDVIRVKAERVFTNPDYTFRYVKRNEFRDVARYFMIIYNKGWARFPGVKTISERHAMLLLKSMKPILDEKLLWFGFYKDEPVCFFLMLPEVNQIIRHLNGNLNLVGKIKFLYYRHLSGQLTKAFGQIFGIVPEHQRKGVEGALIMSFAKLALSRGFRYKDLEFNWIGDYNPSMMHLLDQIGAEIIKTHITYRFMFDPEAPFERSPVVNMA